MLPNTKSHARPTKLMRVIPLIACTLTLTMHSALAMKPIPFVKQWTPTAGIVNLDKVRIADVDSPLNLEAETLRQRLNERSVTLQADGVPIQLRIAAITFPPINSKHAEQLRDQGYRITLDKSGIVIVGQSAAGVYYAVQTFVQLISQSSELACGEIIDWPDYAIRAVMIDSARANENLDYYQRVVDFCALYKMNRLHWHLTDDENASLYHEEFPWLMHPNAWRAQQIAELVGYAHDRHIDIVPEIESLGHARLFVRHPQYKEILHQTTVDKPAKSWAGTSVPGFTNVLCPASPLTIDYLDKMYARAATLFPFPETHIGYDEVDTTECQRCRAKFGQISHSQWLLQHLLQCHKLASRNGRQVGLWGDMLLNHRDIIDRVPRQHTVIYDWHYRPQVTDESLKFFLSQGFEVIACPALVCHPHMVIPSDYCYDNIHNFAELGRANDLVGIDTTIWTPIRYMSDVLWPGIAYAAVHSWSGSAWNEEAFYEQFAKDFYGISGGARFGKLWSELYHLRWWLDRFQVSCWNSEEGLAKAAEAAAGSWGEKARADLESLALIRKAFADMEAGVTKNKIAWQTLCRSVEVFIYVREHFLAAVDVRPEGKWNTHRLRELDAKCAEQIRWMDEDWKRNRFADDPYREDLSNTRQHLLDSFLKMHAFHRRILKEK